MKYIIKFCKFIYKVILSSDTVIITHELIPIDYYKIPNNNQFIEYTVHTKKKVNCPICLINYDKNDEIIKIKHCGHFFHKKCFTLWYSKHQKNCPCCRHPL